MRGIGHRELEQMEPIMNFQEPAEGLELVILLHTMALPVVEFSKEGHKIRKVFA